MNIEIKNSDITKRKLLLSRLIWREDGIVPGVRMTGLKMRAEKKIVEEKIIRGKYLFEDLPCFCGSHEDVLISEVDRHGFYYPVVICSRCGLIRANPRMTREAYNEFYTHEYRDVYGEGDEEIGRLFEYRLEQSKRNYNYFKNYVNLSTNAVVFEIGCDFGTMLLPFIEDGCDAYGCDYGIKHIEYGRERTGLRNLFVGGSEKLRETGKKADLVIVNHVLEHFLDLEKELGVIREIMNPDASIYIAVPGTFWWIENACGGNIMGLLQNAHAYQFSLNLLQYVMECCGFELIHGNEEIRSFFKLSNVLREKSMVPDTEFKKTMVYLEKLERKYLLKSYMIKPLEILGVKDMIKNITRRIR